MSHMGTHVETDNTQLPNQAATGRGDLITDDSDTATQTHVGTDAQRFTQALRHT